jgi:hypothetical protein
MVVDKTLATNGGINMDIEIADVNMRYIDY